MYEIVLYDWKGKIRWAFIQGVYLVDPLYETEFLQQEEDHHLLPDLYFVFYGRFDVHFGQGLYVAAQQKFARQIQ